MPPGDYQLDAMSARGRDDAGVYFASTPLTIGDHDVNDAVVLLKPGSRVSGRIVFEGQPPAASLWPNVPVRLEAVGPALDGVIPVTKPAEDGTFQSPIVRPGRYLLRVGTLVVPRPPTASSSEGLVWWPRSATFGSENFLDGVIDIGADDVAHVTITMTNKPYGSLTGTVRDPRGGADPDAAVLVFPTDSHLWLDFANDVGGNRHIRLATTGALGSYTVTGLAAGEYFVVAGTVEQFADRQAPGALDRLASRATRIRLPTAKRRRWICGDPDSDAGPFSRVARPDRHVRQRDRGAADARWRRTTSAGRYPAG